KMKPVTHLGIRYQPYLESFRLAVEDTEIVTDLTARIHVLPGVDVYAYTTSYHALDFRPTRPALTSHQRHVAAGVTIGFVVLQVLTAALALFAYRASELLDAIVIAVIVAIVIAAEEAVEILVSRVLADGVAHSLGADWHGDWAGTLGPRRR